MVLEDKAAVVYGAGGSMGGAIARALADAGASIFLAGRNPQPLETLAEELRRAGGKAESAPPVDARRAADEAGHLGPIDQSLRARGGQGQHPGEQIDAKRFEELVERRERDRVALCKRGRPVVARSGRRRAPG